MKDREYIVKSFAMRKGEETEIAKLKRYKPVVPSKRSVLAEA